MTIKITPNDKGTPRGMLAEAELHFEDGPLAGLKLIGFSIWERRDGSGRNVTLPSRQYSINGERRSFALLRPASTDGRAPDGAICATQGLREQILEAYQIFEENAALAV